MFTVYVIQNQTSGKMYVGQTADIAKRMARHNGILPSKQRSYTSINKGVWEIVYKEEYGTR